MQVNLKLKEIKEFTLTDDDKVLIVASDGIWEYMENE